METNVVSGWTRPGLLSEVNSVVDRGGSRLIYSSARGTLVTEPLPLRLLRLGVLVIRPVPISVGGDSLNWYRPSFVAGYFFLPFGPLLVAAHDIPLLRSVGSWRTNLTKTFPRYSITTR